MTDGLKIYITCFSNIGDIKKQTLKQSMSMWKTKIKETTKISEYIFIQIERKNINPIFLNF